MQPSGIEHTPEKKNNIYKCVALEVDIYSFDIFSVTLVVPYVHLVVLFLRNRKKCETSYCNFQGNLHTDVSYTCI